MGGNQQREPNFKKPVKVQRSEEGDWILTGVDGDARTLLREWYHLTVHLSDLKVISSMGMNVASAGRYQEEDTYTQQVMIRGIGQFSSWDRLKFMDQADDDYKSINHCELRIRFDRAWNGPPLKKFSAKDWLSESGESDASGGEPSEDAYWSSGESQMGSFHSRGDYYLDEDEPALPVLDLRVPTEFLPVALEAAEKQDRVADIRVLVDVRCYSDGWQFYLPPHDAPVGELIWAFASGVEIEMKPMLPLSVEKRGSLAGEAPRSGPTIEEKRLMDFRLSVTRGLYMIAAALALILIAIIAR